MSVPKGLVSKVASCAKISSDTGDMNWDRMGWDGMGWDGMGRDGKR